MDTPETNVIRELKLFFEKNERPPKIEEFGQGFEKKDGHWSALPSFRELKTVFGDGDKIELYFWALEAAGLQQPDVVSAPVRPRPPRSIKTLQLVAEPAVNDPPPPEPKPEPPKITRVPTPVPAPLPIPKAVVPKPVPRPRPRLVLEEPSNDVKPLKPKQGWGESALIKKPDS